MMLSLRSDGHQPQPQQQQQQAVTPPLPLPPVAFGSVAGSGGLGFSSALFDESPAFSLQTVDSSVDVKPSMQMVKPIEVDDEVHLVLARQSYNAGNYKQALEHCNTVYEKNPQHTGNLLLLGAIYYQLRDFDMCIARNEEALAIDPRFAECYGNMANALKEKGNIDLAIQYYLRAILIRPSFSDAWSNFASAYTRTGRVNEAVQCCRQALALNPCSVDAHSNLGNLMKAQGLINEEIY